MNRKLLVDIVVGHPASSLPSSPLLSGLSPMSQSPSSFILSMDRDGELYVAEVVNGDDHVVEHGEVPW